MYDVAIRFVYSGGNVDFTLDEVGKESVQFLTDFILHENQLLAPQVFLDGQEFTTIEVEFIESTLDTYNKLLALIDSGEELTFYYRYKYDPQTNIKVIPNLDEETENWSYGGRSVNVTHSIKFLICD